MAKIGHHPTTMRFVLEGGVGSGKSTLIQKLAALFPTWHCFVEPISRWQNFHFEGDNYLDRFYKDPSQANCCALQGVIIESYKELMQVTEGRTLQERENLQQRETLQVYERSAFSAVTIFSPANVDMGYLSKVQLAELEIKYQREVVPLGQIDGWIYLRTTPELCRKRTLDRGFRNESDVKVLDMDYAQVVHNLHETVFLNRERTLIVDEFGEEQSLQMKISSISRFIQDDFYRKNGTFVANPDGSITSSSLILS